MQQLAVSSLSVKKEKKEVSEKKKVRKKKETSNTKRMKKKIISYGAVLNSVEY